MEDSLCNSSFGSMVSLDYVTPDTDITTKWQSEPDAKTLRFSCLTVRVRAVPSINEKMIQRPQEFKNVLHIKNLSTPTQDFIPGSKFDNDRSNLSLGTMKALGPSTQRRAGHHQALLPLNGNRIHGCNLLHGHRDQDVEERCFSHSHGVSLTGKRFPAKRRDRIKDSEKVSKVAKFARTTKKNYLMDGSR